MLTTRITPSLTPAGTTATPTRPNFYSNPFVLNRDQLLKLYEKTPLLDITLKLLWEKLEAFNRKEMRETTKFNPSTSAPSFSVAKDLSIPSAIANDAMSYGRTIELIEKLFKKQKIRETQEDLRLTLAKLFNAGNERHTLIEAIITYFDSIKELPNDSLNPEKIKETFHSKHGRTTGTLASDRYKKTHPLFNAFAYVFYACSKAENTKHLLDKKKSIEKEYHEFNELITTHKKIETIATLYKRTEESFAAYKKELTQKKSTYQENAIKNELETFSKLNARKIQTHQLKITDIQQTITALEEKITDYKNEFNTASAERKKALLQLTEQAIDERRTYITRLREEKHNIDATVKTQVAYIANVSIGVIEFKVPDDAFQRELGRLEDYRTTLENQRKACEEKKSALLEKIQKYQSLLPHSRDILTAINQRPEKQSQLGSALTCLKQQSKADILLSAENFKYHSEQLTEDIDTTLSSMQSLFDETKRQYDAEEKRLHDLLKAEDAQAETIQKKINEFRVALKKLQDDTKQDLQHHAKQEINSRFLASDDYKNLNQQAKELKSSIDSEIQKTDNIEAVRAAMLAQVDVDQKAAALAKLQQEHADVKAKQDALKATLSNITRAAHSTVRLGSSTSSSLSTSLQSRTSTVPAAAPPILVKAQLADASAAAKALDDSITKQQEQTRNATAAARKAEQDLSRQTSFSWLRAVVGLIPGIAITWFTGWYHATKRWGVGGFFANLFTGGIVGAFSSAAAFATTTKEIANPEEHKPLMVDAQDRSVSTFNPNPDAPTAPLAIPHRTNPSRYPEGSTSSVTNSLATHTTHRRGSVCSIPSALPTIPGSPSQAPTLHRKPSGPLAQKLKVASCINTSEESIKDSKGKTTERRLKIASEEPTYLYLSEHGKLFYSPDKEKSPPCELKKATTDLVKKLLTLATSEIQFSPVPQTKALSDAIMIVTIGSWSYQIRNKDQYSSLIACEGRDPDGHSCGYRDITNELLSDNALDDAAIQSYILCSRTPSPTQ